MVDIFEKSTDSIRVVHLDDDPSQADLTASFLERESDRFEVYTEQCPAEAIDLVRREDPDCIVSDYDMPDLNGLEFLEEVREEHPDLPFILFTGKGSEEIASEAISRGVTDYLQKGTGSDRYTVLANRIQNAVDQYRAEREVELRSKWYQGILEHSSDYVMVVNGMGNVKYVSPAITRVMGFTQEEIIGNDSFGNIHPDDLEYAATALSETIEKPDKEVTVEFRAEDADGSYRWLEARGSNFLDDPVINGVMVNVRSITKRKNREQALERQKNYHQELTNFLSHDVKNQLNVLMGNIELAEMNGDFDRLDRAMRSAERIEEMIDVAQELAQSEQQIGDPVSVELSAVLRQTWETVTKRNTDADLVVESDVTIDADEPRLRSLLENLLVNAIEHGGPGVTVRAGQLESDAGFYVEDDGPGIPEDEREAIFEINYSTSDEGTGLGLTIVKRIVDAHEWSIRVTESDDGGARFEVLTT